MRREGFYHRRTTTKKKNLSSEETVAAMTSFFLNARMQVSQNPDIMHTHVYNRDQVPMALSGGYATTVDDKSSNVIQDATVDSNDTKRFCTLNLTITMDINEQESNIIRPHLVFKATQFVRGED